jgi:hypothetical protein
LSSVGCIWKSMAPGTWQGWIEATMPSSAMRGMSARSIISICSIRWRASRAPLAWRRGVAVDHPPHRPVADRMHGDLQPAPVGLGRDRGEAPRLENSGSPRQPGASG